MPITHFETVPGCTRARSDTKGVLENKVGLGLDKNYNKTYSGY